MKIRPFTEADQSQVLELARELQAHEVPLFDRMKPASDIGLWYIDALNQQCLEHEGVFLVAEIEGRCVGYATVLTKISEDGKGDEVAHDYAYIHDLAVAASWRGRGIGSQLIGECERHAKSAGRDEIRIRVLASNDGAYRLYRTLGFSDLFVRLRKKLA